VLGYLAGRETGQRTADDEIDAPDEIPPPDGGDRLVLCEINSIPGAWGNHLWDATGVPRNELYRGLVDEALSRRPGLPQWAATSDGTALRTSGSISSKLA